MPAPGGNFAGAASSSRGYAGDGRSTSASGAGGAGGVRNTSSGTKESGGSQARSSSSSSGGSTGNTSRGGTQGSSLGGGLASSAGGSSGGTGNTSRGGASTGSNSGASKAAAAGLQGAARSAYNGPAARDDRAGAYNGGLGTAARGNYMSGRSSASLNAQARAVSRGPGVLAGTRPGDFDNIRDRAAAANRTATSLGLSMAERYGKNPVESVNAVKEMARTLVGETLGLPQVEQDAAARTMFNRMDLNASTGRRVNYGSLLNAYDANGMRVPSARNTAYNRAKPGTAAYGEALQAIASGMSPYGSLANVPDFVQNATNYHNPDTSSPSWGKNAERFGAHAFSSPDPGRSAAQVAAARTGVLGSPGGFAPSDVQVASALGPGASSRVAEFAARGKPLTAASNQVAEFAARGKPVSPTDIQVAEFAARGKPSAFAPSNRVAEFAARGKPAVPSSFAMGRAQEIPTPNELLGRTNAVAGLPNPSGYSFGPAPSPNYTNPGKSYANVGGNRGLQAALSPSPSPAQAYSDPADFARSPLGQAFGAIGNSINAGLQGFGQASKMYADHKGLAGFASAMGINPAAKQVNAALGDAIRGMQNGITSGVNNLAGWAAGNNTNTQVAQGPTTASPPSSSGPLSSPSVSNTTTAPSTPPAANNSIGGTIGSLLASLGIDPSSWGGIASGGGNGDARFDLKSIVSNIAQHAPSRPRTPSDPFGQYQGFDRTMQMLAAGIDPDTGKQIQLSQT